MNEIPQNLYQMRLGQNNNLIQSQPNLFSLPLNLNQIMNNNQNLQNQLLPLLYPDQFLCQNPLFLLQRLLLIPQANQINYLNQLLLEQNLQNPNDILVNNNINNINNIYNNLLNNPQLNNINGNNSTYILNNKNIINEQVQNKPKENNVIINNQPNKKFFITHENNSNLINSQNQNINNINNINIINEKLTPENNKIHFNLLKNESINNNINNNIKPNIKPEEIKETKGKFSLFTISNINTNNNSANDNNNHQLDKSKLIQPIIKIPNNKNEKEPNKNLFNLQHLEEKDDKDKIKYYRCSFKECNKVFQKQSNLKDHIRTHTGEKP